MQTVKIFRVEHATKNIGPYKEFGSWNWTKKNHGLLKRTPMPTDLNHKLKGKLAYEYKFGFSTLKGVHRWFSKTELEALKRHGFVIKELEVPKDNVIKGHRQLIFKL